MSVYIQNPFAASGTIVYGDRFIGRWDDLKVVANRVVTPDEPGNLAIIGDHRIGKSSLAYKAIIDRKNELIAKKQLPIWIDLGRYDHFPSFFRALVIQCYDELEDLGWLTELIKREYQRFLESDFSWNESYDRSTRFFKKVRQEGIKVLFILDEFDHARHLFKEKIVAFQGLRELSYNPEWRVTFITLSRRTIQEIETQSQAGSSFAGIFYNHYLAMFDEPSLQEYFSRLSSVGLSLDSEMQKHIQYFCGSHPYLLEMLGYKIVESFRESQQINVDYIAQQLESSFLEQYDRMTYLLQEDASLNILLQILFGPQVADSKQIYKELHRFLNYGLIQPTKQDTYEAFSHHFTMYLKLIERQIDLWPIWSETELALRRLITTKMIEMYGEKWIEKIEEAHPEKLKPMFDKCRESQQREEKAFGSRASQNLIDFTYPRDLFQIIFAKWKDVFKPILGKDANYWGERATLLSKIRNPLAHNRDAVLYDYLTLRSR
ncbi:hypothetical protein U27_04024 [Candidatus Vecturithrix granuli]|uniref:Swt1-like HEPN domain-containing protein n=1 Tax=Vecturithrix granuli TaxID=1499967 RepID=A0A081BXK5_VECG1|nr:hypothetical protein U27_04024 [Candidatus Vecturithrix granuli]